MEIVWQSLQKALDDSMSNCGSKVQFQPEAKMRLHGVTLQLDDFAVDPTPLSQRPMPCQAATVAAVFVCLKISCGEASVALRGDMYRWPRPGAATECQTHHYEFSSTATNNILSSLARTCILVSIPMLLDPKHASYASLRPSDIGNDLYRRVLAWKPTIAQSAIARPHAQPFDNQTRWNLAFEAAGVTDPLEQLDIVSASASWQRCSADANACDTHPSAEALLCLLGNSPNGVTHEPSARNNLAMLLALHRDIISSTLDDSGAHVDFDVDMLPADERAGAGWALEQWHTSALPAAVLDLCRDRTNRTDATDRALSAPVMGPHTLGFMQALWTNCRVLAPDGVRAHATIALGPPTGRHAHRAIGSGKFNHMLTAAEIVADDELLVALFGPGEPFDDHLAAVHQHLERALQVHLATTARSHSHAARPLAYVKINPQSTKEPSELLVGDAIVLEVHVQTLGPDDVGRKIPFVLPETDRELAAKHIEVMAAHPSITETCECCFVETEGVATPVLLLTATAADLQIDEPAVELLRRVNEISLSMRPDDPPLLMQLHESFNKRARIAANVQSRDHDGYGVTALSHVSVGQFQILTDTALTRADIEDWTRPLRLRKSDSAFVTASLLPYAYRARVMPAETPAPGAFQGPLALNKYRRGTPNEGPCDTPWGTYSPFSPCTELDCRAAMKDGIAKRDEAAVAAMNARPHGVPPGDECDCAALLRMTTASGVHHTIVVRRDAAGATLLATGPRTARHRLEMAALASVLRGHSGFACCEALRALEYTNSACCETIALLRIRCTTRCDDAADSGQTLLRHAGATGTYHDLAVECEDGCVAATISYTALGTK
jgi:hypothetical protein